jgi:S1-C subfamily serine protease
MRRMAILMLLLSVDRSIALAGPRDYPREQAAIKQATNAVADSVVQIRTVGGFERIGETTLSQGPTTGLIITSDGYIVSSAINLAQRPSSILVRLPSGRQVPAELVARDLNRMLVLLKVETDAELPVPAFVPEREIAVGQWSLALGRTFQADKVDASLGIISALNRMHGRVVQTDANVSAANYGGPLVDIRGRVFGILVPMSPQASGDGIESEVAGTEFYDSGIGFAVPLEHVLSVLDRWKAGEDLLPGKLGVGLKAGSPFVEAPSIVSVWPGSPAADAGWKADDVIIAVKGKPVATQTQLQFFTKPVYAGDRLTISIRRGTDDKAEEFDTEITLAGKLAPYRHAFLGIRPALANEEKESKDVLVDAVWPDSPATKAGVKQGDRLTKLGESETPNLASALTAMKALQVGEEVKLTVVRDENEVALTATLGNLPENVLTSIELPLDTPASAAPRELESLKLPQFPQEAKFIKPAKKSALPGLVVWLLEKGEQEKLLVEAWQEICDRDGLVLLFARPASEDGWQFDDLEYLDELARTARGKLSADPQRTIIAGRDKAGQLAAVLGLRRRGDFSGLITDNAPLPRTLKVPENKPEGQIAILTIVPRNSTFAPLIKNDITQLREAGFAVSLLDRPAAKGEAAEFDPASQAAIARWIAGLRRF